MYDENGARLPGHWTICENCRGDGKHSKHLGSWTSSEWAEEDRDFQEDYLAGHYDRICEECKGSGKLWEVDVSRCTFGQKRLLVRQRQEATVRRGFDAEQRAEMRAMGYEC